MTEPRDKIPSILKRDEHNNLDHDDARKVTDDLVKKLITEQRDYQKEISFKHSRSNRRDIVLKIVLYQRNTVNGKIVRDDADDPLFERLGDEPLDPYRYKYFDHIDGEIAVREMPMPMGKAGKWILGCFKGVTNYLARMGIFHEV